MLQALKAHIECIFVSLGCDSILLPNTKIPKVLFITDEALVDPKEKELFYKMVKAMGLGKNEFCETNFSELKVEMLEAENCPKVICSLGDRFVKQIMAKQETIDEIRGKVLSYKNFKVIPTFAISFLLKNEDKKKIVWQDLQTVMRQIEAN